MQLQLEARTGQSRANGGDEDGEGQRAYGACVVWSVVMLLAGGGDAGLGWLVVAVELFS